MNEYQELAYNNQGIENKHLLNGYNGNSLSLE
jgi:hypothetical protein